MIDNEMKLIQYLENEFPLSSAEKWDFVGYSLKNKTKKEKQLKILTCLDVNKDVVNKVINENFSLIICFHPFKFGKSWSDIYKYDKSKKELNKQLRKHKINVYSIHTNFDKHKKGTKYWLTKKLNLLSNVISNYEYASTIKVNSKVNELILFLKNELNINYVLTNINKEDLIIEKIFLAPGASDVYEFMRLIEDKNIVLVTSDVKWNEQQLLNDLGYKFILLPHKIEEVFNEGIQYFLKKELDKNIIVESIYFEDFMKGY